MSDIKSFMSSDAGASARYQSRRERRISISIDDIEPQSKKMSPADRTDFQAAVAEQLTAVKRSTFRGTSRLNSTWQLPVSLRRMHIRSPRTS
ncbi:hypothetical protein [Sinorhizobium meliloti]|uniref:hypothetical protein n=1 Tax=Rhizobium meliloti TaxID=382 RepID=UPI001912E828|nr:hypothetical protein [Sinorhizobium meliloti]